MGSISRRIELYNAAYATAWADVSKDLNAITPSTALALAMAIRAKIKTGEDDAEIIAAAAVASLIANSR